MRQLYSRPRRRPTACRLRCGWARAANAAGDAMHRIPGHFTW